MNFAKVKKCKRRLTMNSIVTSIQKVAKKTGLDELEVVKIKQIKTRDGDKKDER